MMKKLREGNQFILQINGILSSSLNMALVCVSFSQLGIQLVSTSIHFHESCHSFESFKRMHCPMSYCVPPRRFNAAEFFIVSPDVQREVESLPLQSKQSLCQYLLSQSYGCIIYIIMELCSKFCVVDVGFITDLLRRDYSCQHQLVIQELILETKIVP